MILKDEHLNEFETNTLVSAYLEIETITQKVLKNREAFYTTLEREIYKEYAPFDIMYPLNLTYLILQAI